MVFGQTVFETLSLNSRHTSENVCTEQLSNQDPTTFYTRKLLHQSTLTPEKTLPPNRFHTRATAKKVQLFHGTRVEWWSIIWSTHWKHSRNVKRETKKKWPSFMIWYEHENWGKGPAEAKGNYFAKTFSRQDRWMFSLFWTIDHLFRVVHRGLHQAHARRQDEAPNRPRKLLAVNQFRLRCAWEVWTIVGCSKPKARPNMKKTYFRHAWPKVTCRATHIQPSGALARKFAATVSAWYVASGSVGWRPVLWDVHVFGKRSSKRYSILGSFFFGRPTEFLHQKLYIKQSYIRISGYCTSWWITIQLFHGSFQNVLRFSAKHARAVILDNFNVPKTCCFSCITRRKKIKTHILKHFSNKCS